MRDRGSRASRASGAHTQQAVFPVDNILTARDPNLQHRRRSNFSRFSSQSAAAAAAAAPGTLTGKQLGHTVISLMQLQSSFLTRRPPLLSLHTHTGGGGVRKEEQRRTTVEARQRREVRKRKR